MNTVLFYPDALTARVCRSKDVINMNVKNATPIIKIVFNISIVFGREQWCRRRRWFCCCCSYCRCDTEEQPCTFVVGPPKSRGFGMFWWPLRDGGGGRFKNKSFAAAAAAATLTGRVCTYGGLTPRNGLRHTHLSV